MKLTKNELLIEIGHVNQAIRAWEMGMKWLSPDVYSEAPSFKWLLMQRRGLRKYLEAQRAAGE